MYKEVRLYQVSHKYYAIAVKNVVWSESGALIQIVKKHGGRWNIAIAQFEYPLQNTASLIKEIKHMDEKLAIKDVPTLQLKNLFFHAQAQDDRKVLHLQPKNKWNRVLLLDSLLVRRHEFIGKFINTSVPKNSSSLRDSFKRVLMICWDRVRKNWNESLQALKISTKEADYQSLMPEQSYKIACTPLLQSEVDILTYERLDDYAINKKSLDKYTTIICDDCEIWFNNQNALYSSHDIGTHMKKILTQCFSPEKDLVLITAKLPLHKSNLIQEICNILKPKQYGCDVFRIARNECNDATWMKKRYIKDNKFSRELLYLLQSTLLINLNAPKQCQKKKTIESSLENRVFLEPESHSLQRIKAIDNRYKNINRKAVLSSFQSERSKNSYLLSDTSKLEEVRYLKQIREALILDKMPVFTKYLYHLVKELGQRAILVIENLSTLEKVQKFLIEQQVPYLIYEISCEELKKGRSYLKFNIVESYKLCILVRDKLLQEYRKCKLQYEKEIEEEIQYQAEQELGLADGNLYELAIHHRSKLSHDLFKKEQLIELPKLNSAHHLICLDTYWHEFSPQKESIISNILNTQQQFFTEISSNDKVCEYGATIDNSFIQSSRKLDFVKHYFICKKGYDKIILQKYSLNLKAHEEEQQEKQHSDQPLSLPQFTQVLLDKHMKKCEGRQLITEIYDIDQQFDRLEFQALKDKEKPDASDDETPRYNNRIEGLVAETPCIKEIEMLAKEKHSQSKGQAQVLEQTEMPIEQIAWLNDQDEKEDQEDDSEEGSIDLRNYLASERVNEKQSEEYLMNLDKVKEKQETQKIAQVSSDSFASSICLELQQSEEKEVDKTVPKEYVPKRQKLLIDEPVEVIDLDDGEDYNYLLPIVERQTSYHHSYRQSYKQNYHQSSASLNFNTQKSAKQRTPAVPGLKLWGSKGSGRKVIARKYMSLKIHLIPNKSSLRTSQAH